jgi:succinate dehydrogenase/fumarate reductase flavoprotein subunit
LKAASQNDVEFSDIERRTKEAINNYLGVMRTERGLKRCMEILKDNENYLDEIRPGCGQEIRAFSRVRNMILTGRLVVQQALSRKESQGSHYREDFPASVISTSI